MPDASARYVANSSRRVAREEGHPRWRGTSASSATRVEYAIEVCPVLFFLHRHFGQDLCLWRENHTRCKAFEVWSGLNRVISTRGGDKAVGEDQGLKDGLTVESASGRGEMHVNRDIRRGVGNLLLTASLASNHEAFRGEDKSGEGCQYNAYQTSLA